MEGVTAGVTPVTRPERATLDETSPSWEHFSDSRDTGGSRTSAVNQAAPLAKNPVFVGREQELVALTVGLDRALAGHGGLILVSGEPGIGKSRLTDELGARAREREMHVLWGRCWEAGGAPAYWPWVQSLRAYIRELDPKALGSRLGRGAGDLAQLVPEVRDVVSVPPRSAAVDPETARFRLFEAVAEFLRRGGEARPLLLVLDDLHAADTSSLLLLQFLAADLADARLLVVSAYRDVDPTIHEPLSSALAELARLPVTRILALTGLDKPEVASFISESAGVKPDDALVTAMHEETEGNPLFLGEVVRLLVSEGRLPDVALAPFPRLEMPQGIRAVIDHRLGRLSEECRRLLTLASVLGREFGLDALGIVSGFSPSRAIELLEDAISERVVTLATPGRLRFSHALIRDVLYDELPPARRIRLHREIGEALERVYEDPEPHLAELAYHFASAAPAGNVEKAIDYARRAAERAVQLLAYEEAARLFEEALQTLDLRPSSDPRTECELLLGLGDARARAGTFGEAKRTFLQAAEIAKSANFSELLARAALGYGGRFVWEPGRGDRYLLPLLEDALAALPETDSELRVRVAARLAGGPLQDIQAAEKRRAVLSLEAVETGRRLGHAPTLAYALDGRCVAIWGPQETIEERQAVTSELVEVAEAAGDKELMFDGHLFRFAVAVEVGDMGAAYTELEAQTRLAEELRQPAQLWFEAVLRTTLATFEGRFAEAEELLDTAMKRGARAAGLIAELYQIVQLWALRREQGRLAEMERQLTDASRRFGMYEVLRCIRVHVDAELGNERSARAELRALAADGFAALPLNDDWIFEVCLLADANRLLNDAIDPSFIYELLLPFADRNAFTPPGACIGSVARQLGIVAGSMGQWNEAERHFELAFERNAAMGARPWAARTTCDWAEMLLRRDGPGDRNRGEELLAGAAHAAGQLGMNALLERIAALGERVGDATSKATRSVFRRDGEYWSIAHERDAFRLKDSKGLRYLAQLLMEPGREFLALDLVAGERKAERVAGIAEPGLTASLEHAGEILDARGKAEYRRRLDELENELEMARAFGDAQRAERAEVEREFLVRELAGAIGLGGRDRRMGSPSERARVSVTRAIRSALTRIREHSSALGDHLERTIHTGTYCSYTPDPRAPIEWRV
jgi:tetratricopeptide (TPR) repeat protein